MRTVKSYSSASKVFHWTTALIVILMLSLSFFLGDVPEANQEFAYMIHKSFGITVLALIIIRIIWIKVRGKPILPLNIPHWQRMLARTVQYSLYFFLLAMPITGWVGSVAAGYTPSFFNLFMLPLPIAKNEELAKVLGNAHEVIAWILIALIVLHVAGALKHYFIDKDEVLQTMLPGHK